MRHTKMRNQLKTVILSMAPMRNLAEDNAESPACSRVHGVWSHDEIIRKLENRCCQQQQLAELAAERNGVMIASAT